MFTKPFSQLSKTDADIAGGKGASLGEMLQSNIPVPDGYVVLSTTFDEFLHKADLVQEIEAILGSVNHKTVHSIDTASEKIQELIKHATMPEDIKAEIESQFSSLNSEFVAVRSSATAEDGADHAWAGQLESYLNTTQDTLLEKVQHCWASLFTPRAIFYRFEKGLDTTKISVAVVVQKMVNSEKSGIAFSVHPVTEDRNQIIIEAGFGLGEAIVSGSVTPDSYVVEKEPRKIIDINVSNQTRAMYRKVGGGNEWQELGEKGGTQVFSEPEILDLANIIMTIENHYGFPCDIEWAFENEKFYVVQSRPITTLLNSDTTDSEVDSDLDYFNNFSFQASRPQNIQRDEFVCNTYRQYENFGFRFITTPLEGTQRALWIDGDFEKKLYNHLLDVVSTEQGFKKDLEEYDKLKGVYTEIDKKFTKKSFSKQELSKLLDEYNQAWGLFGEQIWLPFPLERILDKKFADDLKQKYPDNFEEMYGAISDPTILNDYQKMRMEMYLAVIENKDKEKISQELETKYYWSSEYSYVEPFLTKQYFLDEMDKLTIVSAKEEYEKLKHIETKNKEKFEKVVAEINDPTLNLQAKVLNAYVYIRTDRVDVVRRFMAPFRNIYEKIAEYLKQDTDKNWRREDIVNMLSSEINDYLYGKNIPDLEEIKNRNDYIYVHDSQGTRLIKDKNLVDKIVNYLAEKNSNKESVKGKVAYKGKIQGIAVLVYSKDDLPKVTEESILIARTTMVEYTPAMERAKAFVTAEGGITSHAAIVARELKKPCIVGTGNCMDLIKNGDLVEVDANNGVVRVIK